MAGIELNKIFDKNGKKDSSKLSPFAIPIVCKTKEIRDKFINRFIENEIEYLAKGFDKIVIFTHSPTSYKKRQLPNNMEVRQLSYEITNLDKIKSLVLNIPVKKVNKLVILLKYQ